MLGCIYAYLVLEVWLRDLDKSFHISYLYIENFWIKCEWKDEKTGDFSFFVDKLYRDRKCEMKRYLIHSIFGCIMLWVIVKVRMCVKIIYYRYHVSTYIDLFRELPAAAQLDIYVWYAFFIYKAIECQSVCLSVCLFHKSYWWHWLVCVLKVACLNIAFEVYITVTQNCLCVCNLSLTKTAELNSWKASFWLWVIFLVKNLWFYRILFPGNPKQSFRGKVCPFWEFQFFSFIYTSGCAITKLQWFLQVFSKNFLKSFSNVII